MGRGKHRPDRGRDGEGFVPFTHVLFRSEAFKRASPRAIKLFIDLASQFNGHNNGQLVASFALMEKRGWRSEDTLFKARRELEALGLVQETRKGQRPNKATWYALSHLRLHWTPEMDIAESSFRRGLYAQVDVKAALASLHARAKLTPPPEVDEFPTATASVVRDTTQPRAP